MVALNYRVFGDPASPALMLIHGLFGSSANWGSLARRLTGPFHVVVPDLRNHGQSPWVPEQSYPAMAEDLASLMDDRAIDRAILVGHSMGGKVAMQFALTWPARVRGLVVVDIAPVDYRRNFQDVLDALTAVDLDRLGSRAEAEHQLAGAIPAPGLRAFLLQNLVKKDGAWRWRIHLPALADAQSEITGFPTPTDRYPAPALFLHGERSDYVQPGHHALIHRLFPAAEIEAVPGAGHWVYADQPQAFVDRLQGFLDGVT